MSDFTSNRLNPNAFYLNQETYAENPSSSSSGNPILSSSTSYEAESSNDSEKFSESPLNHITNVLMNENDNLENHPEHNRLEAAEKPFYDLLGISYPPLQSHSDLNNWYDYSQYQVPFEFTGNSVFGITNKFGMDPAKQFNKGVEEGLKFLPNINIDDPYGFSMTEIMAINSEKLERVRKNPDHADPINDQRMVKQSVTSSEPVDRNLFDEVLLCEDDKFPESVNDIRKTLQNVTIGNKKGRRKNSEKDNKVDIDLNTILTKCAQMVASNNREQTEHLLKQIRCHSSPTGNGSQRMAHYFANGLEARIAGTGVKLYRNMARRETASEFMKAYQLYVAACPFKKLSYFFSNQTILDIVGMARSVHVIDFGINYGFQWPSLIKRLSGRPGGAPRLRITGIDFPETGFRPGERIEETGRRLHEYAESFNVPFEYNCIASKWENVRIEELRVSGEDEEVLVVNCLYQMRYLMDETVEMDSPRDRVLKMIRGLKPDVFVLGIVNGAYNAPFFLTRFREALFYFSALYDMKDSIVPRGHEVRYSVEREILGREVMNVVACEGVARVERPENYKQWQARNVRAGFVQHEVNEEIMKKAKEKVDMFYHKEFDVEERSRWLLQGWKGRSIYALSSWKPK